MKVWLLRSPTSGQLLVGIQYGATEIVMPAHEFKQLLELMGQAKTTITNVNGQTWTEQENARLLAGQIIYKVAGQ